MRVPRSLLPLNPGEWHGFLREYFCDKDAVAISENDAGFVELKLLWPDAPDRYVDPEIARGLRWWGRDVTLGSMWASRRRQGRILTALFDTWTLLSWSEWVQRVGPAAAEDAVILHVDDHRDLGSPRLLSQGAAVLDAISGAPFRMREPDSVRLAIESGAIGMGSFMTPFLHEFPSVQLRHLCQPPKVVADTWYSIQLSFAEDTLLHPGQRRQQIRLTPTLAGQRSSCLTTADERRWAEDIGGRPALVHIDMDYFNNRYDGDSDWPERTSVLDPELPCMLRKADELVSALADSNAEIQDVVIAYSPGFFPAEFWEPMDLYLRDRLRQIL